MNQFRIVILHLIAISYFYTFELYFLRITFLIDANRKIFYLFSSYWNNNVITTQKKKKDVQRSLPYFLLLFSLISLLSTGMRILVMLLLDTLPMLGNVLLLCFFVFFIFGIVGVQLWEGILRQRCFLKALPNVKYPE